jgi:hypothetical protein
VVGFATIDGSTARFLDSAAGIPNCSETKDLRDNWYKGFWALPGASKDVAGILRCALKRAISEERDI